MVGKSGRSTKARGWTRSTCEDAKFEDADDDDFPSINPLTRDESTPFRFVDLSSEMKNMIYLYLVTPDHGEPLRLTKSYSRSSQISTAILYVDRQLHQEASAVLYSRNTLQLTPGCQFRPKQILRQDQALGGTRRLRNGRLSGSTKFTGIIYPHVLRRFRKIELAFRVDLYARGLPIRVDMVGFNLLKELLQVMSSEEPVQNGPICKSLQLKATEPDYASLSRAQMPILSIQSVVSELEKHGFPAIFKKLRQSRDLVLTGNLCDDSRAALTRCILA